MFMDGSVQCNVSKNSPTTRIEIHYFITTMKTNTCEHLLSAEYKFLV